jgi:hypothetical protein
VSDYYSANGESPGRWIGKDVAALADPGLQPVGPGMAEQLWTLPEGSEVTELHDVFGSAIAETIAADPAWPALVAAITAADPAGWTPRDLLHLAAEHLADTDPEQSIAPYEYARLITYTVDLFAGAHPGHSHGDIPTPDDPPLSPEDEEQLPPDPRLTPAEPPTPERTTSQRPPTRPNSSITTTTARTE